MYTLKVSESCGRREDLKTKITEKGKQAELLVLFLLGTKMTVPQDVLMLNILVN